MSYTEENTLSFESRIVSFGFNDDRGRECGILIKTGASEFVALPEGARGGWKREPGTYLFAFCQATRAGEQFGATPYRQYFANEQEREAYINKRINATRKAYEKKFR